MRDDFDDYKTDVMLEKGVNRFGEIQSKFLFCLELGLLDKREKELVKETLDKLFFLQFTPQDEFWILSNTALELVNFKLSKCYYK